MFYKYIWKIVLAFSALIKFLIEGEGKRVL